MYVYFLLHTCLILRYLQSMVWIGAAINILDIVLGCLVSSSISFSFEHMGSGGSGKVSASSFEGVHAAMIIGGISAVVSAALRMW